LIPSLIANIRFHNLRHTAALLLLSRKVPIIVVSKILGHVKPSITMDIYGHLYNEMMDEASEITEKLVTPIFKEGVAKVKSITRNCKY